MNRTPAATLLVLTALLTGCGAHTSPALLAPQTVGAALHGNVHGGQQPVAGATVQLYSVSTVGDGFAATPLVSQVVKTNSSGGFDLTNLFSCPSPAALVYLTAAGGNPGLAAGTENHALSLMTALGPCGDLADATFVTINEVTTVGAVSALAPFMNSYTSLGSGIPHAPQLSLAFAQAALLVNTATGTAAGAGLPATVAAPIAAINTLADILATCGNSAGGAAGDLTPCGLLFAAAQTGQATAAATETIGAALQILKAPTGNPAALFNLSPAAAPFQPTLSTPPATWAIALPPTFFQVYVDAASGIRPIDPNIYGIVSYGLDPAFAAEIQVPNERWGGDAASRYNWQVDSSNAGFDFFFMGGDGNPSPVPSAGADAFVHTAKAAGGQPLLTIPIIPYVNKTAAWNCSFPVRVYGPQQQTNPYIFPNGDTCGNSLALGTNAQLLDTDILANNTPNSPALQAGWVQHLVQTFGSAAAGGVALYQLDNEPLGWSNTHRDLQPTTPKYTDIVSLGQQYAAAIKQVDSSALILGPSDFTLGGWVGDPSSQNGLLAGQYYLQQMGFYDYTHGGRILDYFDEHYYPDTSTPAAQLAVTRTLWDPTYNSGTWVEQYVFNGPMNLIPRFGQWIAQYDPGTKIAFSEYSIDSGRNLITDALAEADVLGIFGQQGVSLANMWIPPAPTAPIAYSFRLFRNYDGQGARFGETGLQALSSDPTQLAVYAAKRAADNTLTLVILNKTAAALTTTLALHNLQPQAAAATYQYTAANLTQIIPQSTTPVTAGALTTTFPAYSATVLAIPTQ